MDNDRKFVPYMKEQARVSNREILGSSYQSDQKENRMRHSARSPAKKYKSPEQLVVEQYDQELDYRFMARDVENIPRKSPTQITPVQSPGDDNFSTPMSELRSSSRSYDGSTPRRSGKHHVKQDETVTETMTISPLKVRKEEESFLKKWFEKPTEAPRMSPAKALLIKLGLEKSYSENLERIEKHLNAVKVSSKLEINELSSKDVEHLSYLKEFLCMIEKQLKLIGSGQNTENLREQMDRWAVFLNLIDTSGTHRDVKKEIEFAIRLNSKLQHDLGVLERRNLQRKRSETRKHERIVQTVSEETQTSQRSRPLLTSEETQTSQRSIPLLTSEGTQTSANPTPRVKTRGSETQTVHQSTEVATSPETREFKDEVDLNRSNYTVETATEDEFTTAQNTTAEESFVDDDVPSEVEDEGKTLSNEKLDETPRKLETDEMTSEEYIQQMMGGTSPVTEKQHVEPVKEVVKEPVVQPEIKPASTTPRRHGVEPLDLSGLSLSMMIPDNAANLSAVSSGRPSFRNSLSSRFDTSYPQSHLPAQVVDESSLNSSRPSLDAYSARRIRESLAAYIAGEEPVVEPEKVMPEASNDSFSAHPAQSDTLNESSLLMPKAHSKVEGTTSVLSNVSVGGNDDTDESLLNFVLQANKNKNAEEPVHDHELQSVAKLPPNIFDADDSTDDSFLLPKKNVEATEKEQMSHLVADTPRVPSPEPQRVVEETEELTMHTYLRSNIFLSSTGKNMAAKAWSLRSELQGKNVFQALKVWRPRRYHEIRELELEDYTDTYNSFVANLWGELVELLNEKFSKKGKSASSFESEYLEEVEALFDREYRTTTELEYWQDITTCKRVGRLNTLRVDPSREKRSMASEEEQIEYKMAMCCMEATCDRYNANVLDSEISIHVKKIEDEMLSLALEQEGHELATNQ